MKLILFNDGSEDIQDPGDEVIRESLLKLSGSDDPRAVLEKTDDDSDFIRLSLEKNGTACCVEFHETATGEEELAGIKEHYVWDGEYVSFDEIYRHFSCDGVELDLAIEIFQLYSEENDRWREKLSWEPVPELTSSYFLSDTVRENPDSPAAHLNRGMAYFNETWIEKAIEDFDSALRLSPEDATAFYFRGLSHDIEGNREQAEADLTEAIRIEPERGEAWFHRGYSRFQTLDGKVLKDAVEDLTEAIRLDPAQAEAWNIRGCCRVGIGIDHEDRSGARDLSGLLGVETFAEALKDYEQAIRLDPQIESREMELLPSTEARALFNKARENVAEAETE